MKRILSAMLAAMMILSLAGCSNDTESELREEIDRLQDEIDDLENERDNSNSDAASDNESDTSVSDNIDGENTTSVIETVEIETTEPEITRIRLEEVFRHEMTDGKFTLLDANPGYENDGMNHILFSATIDGQPVIEVAYIDWSDMIITVEFEDGYTRIPNHTLRDATGLTTIIFPDTVTRIEDDVCCHCESLTNVNIPDNIEFLGEYAFYDCEKIEATYRGKTYTYDMLPQLRADINANNAE